jgi:dipeptidyl aminopeptidase/acylaminoacyl peptidase
MDRTETRVMKWDTATGDIAVLFQEDPALACALMPTSHIRTMLMPLPDRNQVIWYSERSGWAHLYLYNLTSGELIATLTQGEWLVRALLHYDAERQELIIQTADRTAGRNPYLCDICRVSLENGELTPIISTNHDYSVQDQRHTPSTDNKGVSPTGNYVVTTRARIDELPVSLLLDRQGKEILILETADPSAMPTNWQWPEPVMVKGADKKTDIAGIIYRPSNFDPNQSYPILDLSWGHSPPVTPFMGGWFFYGALAWAELGFIVVKFGNRGGGLRDKVFHDDIDPAHPHYNKDDCAAGIQQLAERHSYMDINRVGVASYTLYPEALTGLLIHPDVYKVGVDINPMSDARLMPQLGNFGGGTVFPPYENFVENLQGKLLLIHGMKEDVVLVAATFRLVDALQKACKSFDMLLLPNVNHYGPLDYATKRSWDYLVEHLLGEEPPKEFKLVLTAS